MASVVWICRLEDEEGEEEEEEGGEEADVHLKSNTPTLKGGEKTYVLQNHRVLPQIRPFVKNRNSSRALRS